MTGDENNVVRDNGYWIRTEIGGFKLGRQYGALREASFILSYNAFIYASRDFLWW